ncbi:hypothetical protein EJI01_25130 [Variovorax sp. MHTC-1]|nr:hypothetical protein EJI01_25130 [Variovorax sp. MHTC-1]
MIAAKPAPHAAPAARPPPAPAASPPAHRAATAPGVRCAPRLADRVQVLPEGNLLRGVRQRQAGPAPAG